MSAAAKSWEKRTPAEQEAAVRELEADSSASIIAWRLGATKADVARICASIRRQDDPGSPEPVSDELTAPPAPSGKPSWDLLNRAERDELLIELCKEGLTAPQIADRFYGAPSRSAILGHLHRMRERGMDVRLGRSHGQRQIGGARTSKPRQPRAPKLEKSAAPRGRKMRLIAGAPQIQIGSGPKAASQYDFKARAEQRAASPGLPTHLVTGEPRRPIVEHSIVVPISRRLALVDLSDKTCRWPNGDPLTDDFSFCGNDVSSGRYCTYHARLAYTPPTYRLSAPKGA